MRTSRRCQPARRQTTTRSARRSRATCAAAPATPRSSRPSRWRPTDGQATARAPEAARPMPRPFEPAVDSPRSLAEAYSLLEPSADGRVRPIAGGTDLMVQITGELGEPPERVVDLWRLDELRGIRQDGDALVIGALTTYTELRGSELVADHLPVLAEVAA